jgi:hypothetical protein
MIAAVGAVLLDAALRRATTQLRTHLYNSLALAIRTSPLRDTELVLRHADTLGM